MLKKIQVTLTNCRLLHNLQGNKVARESFFFTIITDELSLTYFLFLSSLLQHVSAIL